MEKIIQKGSRILEEKAKEVLVSEIGSKKIKDIIKRMARALTESENGVAIAAPQIGEPWRIFLVAGEVFSAENMSEKDFAEAKAKKIPPVVFINPIIKKISKKKASLSEGCLSVDGYFGTVERAEKISLEAVDEKGLKISRGASGLLAQIFQHETDHLDGVLFTEKAKNVRKIEEKK